ncbi:MAG: hypothetical protein OXE99_08600 [Cellvibrionales bacterium]|nr:hypothetical protein [Cellvibrionales bacterium]
MDRPALFLWLVFIPSLSFGIEDETCIEERKTNTYCDITKSPENPRSSTQNGSPKELESYTANDICLNNRCVLITADTQYPRTGRSISEEEKAKNHLKAYFAAIRAFSDDKGDNFLGMIINGDITEYGHSGERKVMQGLFDTLDKPIWFGLGNHDYLNNANDCWMNRCTTGTLDWFVNQVLKKDSILATDHVVKDVNEFPIIVREYIGSFAYRFELEGIQFLQLNHSDNYSYQMKREFNAELGKTTNVHIQPSLKWVRKQLEDAHAKKQPIILLSHDHSLSHYTTANSLRNNVSAHYFGHWHGDPEVIRTNACNGFGGDKILSGTGFEGSGIIVEIDKKNNALYNYAFYNNNLESFVLLKITELR